VKTIAAFLFSAIAALGIAVISAPPANAGCQPIWSPWGGTDRCDGPIQPDGTFERCDNPGSMGFSLPRQCYIVDSNNLGSNLPYIPD
jgi:hypothetical protein